MVSSSRWESPVEFKNSARRQENTVSPDQTSHQDSQRDDTPLRLHPQQLWTDMRGQDASHAPIQAHDMKNERSLRPSRSRQSRSTSARDGSRSSVTCSDRVAAVMTSGFISAQEMLFCLSIRGPQPPAVLRREKRCQQETGHARCQ